MRLNEIDISAHIQFQICSLLFEPWTPTHSRRDSITRREFSVFRSKQIQFWKKILRAISSRQDKIYYGSVIINNIIIWSNLNYFHTVLFHNGFKHRQFTIEVETNSTTYWAYYPLDRVERASNRQTWQNDFENARKRRSWAHSLSCLRKLKSS